MKTVEITIGPKGDVQLETRGFAGKACQFVSQALISSLGACVSEQLTAEFYQSEPAFARQANAASTPFSLGAPRP